MSVYQNGKVKHSCQCHSTDCLLEKKHEHCSVFCFDTETTSYYAESLSEAAKLWIAGGQKELVMVQRVG